MKIFLRIALPMVISLSIVGAYIYLSKDKPVTSEQAEGVVIQEPEIAPPLKHFIEGKHYQVFDVQVEENGVSIESDLERNRIYEFFSYGCIHCKNFAPVLNAWKEQNPDVNVQYAPIIWNEATELYARAYFAIKDREDAEALHLAMFETVAGFLRTDTVEDQQVKLIKEFNAQGVQPIELLEKMDSPEADAYIGSLVSLSKRYEVNSTPTLIVSDKYKVLNDQLGSVGELLEVAHMLITQQP